MALHLLSGDALEVALDTDTLGISVTHQSSGLQYELRPTDDPDVEVIHGSTRSWARLSEARSKEVRRYSVGSEERLTCLLTGLPGGVGVTVTLALSQDASLRIEVESLPTTSSAQVGEVRYPGPVAMRDDDAQYTVWPNSGGTIIPSQHHQDIAASTPIYDGLNVVRAPYAIAFTHPLYQPWWGVVGAKGAYMAIAETPFDFALELQHPAGGPTLTKPVWVPSLGRLSYPRAIQYRFLEGASYSTLAKAYREYIRGCGKWVSLSEKLSRNPVAQRLLGSTIFPVSICRHNMRQQPVGHEVTSFAERARQIRHLHEIGRQSCYFHVDGWGYRGYDNLHPDVFPPCPEAGGWEGLVELSRTAKECGYLFGLHDQYRDYYLDGPSFSEALAVKGADGQLPQWSRWAGGAQAVLCAKEALPFVRRNFAELRGRGVELSASYLDVFAIVPLDECYDSQHPMTREDCFRGRANALDHVRRLGIAISSEEPVDCFVPHLDFAHWAPYPCENYAYRDGEYWGIPVPLHSLVYHDAILMPAVFDYGRSPEMRKRHFLEGLSQVDIPYGNMEWDRPECFRYTDIMAALHAAWGTHELLEHRLLSPDGMVQEFEYPQGKVSIDLGALRYKIEGGPMATDGWTNVDL